MPKIILLMVLLQICASHYTLDLSNSILLTNNFTNISTVAVDQQNSYLVSFQDGQARKYTPNFSSYIALNVSQTVEKFISKRLDFSISLSNGSVFSILSDMTVTISNNQRTLRAYSYPDFQQIQQYTFSEPILDYQGFSIVSGPINPFHILVFNNSTKVIYNGVITTVFNTSSQFGTGFFTTAVALKECVIQDLLDIVHFTFYYYHGVSQYGLVQIDIELVFQYNFTSFVFDLSATADQQVGTTFLENARSIFVVNGVALIQLNSFEIFPYAQDDDPDYYQDQYIQNNEVLGFYYITDTYYILYTQGWIAVEFDSDDSIITATHLIRNLPNNLYQLSFGIEFDILFVPGTAEIYKAKCFNQTLFSLGTCASYTCTVANCDYCPLTSAMCQICALGFVRTDQLTCVVANNVTNSSFTALNLTNNSANNSNITNTSVPFSNNTFPINSTYPAQQSSFSSTFSSLFPFFSSLSSLYSELLNATKNVASVPSFRRISPTFYYFANFDDLYLYSFHDRVYGNIMNSFFTELINIQNAKWSLFDYRTLLRLIGASNSSFYSQIDYQNAYITYSFQTPDLPVQGSEAILVNCTNFFLTAGPLMLIFFIIFRLLFRLLFQYPVSQFLRKFSLWGYVFIALFDGNIQQFAFYQTSEWRNIFFFSMSNKLLKSSVLFFGFILVAVSAGGFLVGFGFYRKLNKYLVDNNKNNLSGAIFLLIQYGLRNFIFGMLHSILRPLPYQTMITILLMLEMTLFLTFIISLSFKVYKTSLLMWLYILISFIRILMIFSLAVDYEQVNQEIIEGIQCTLIVCILFVYFLATLVLIVVLMLELIFNIVRLCKQKQVKPQILPCKNIRRCSINLQIVPDIGKHQSFKKFQTQKDNSNKKSKNQGVFRLKNMTLMLVQVERQPKAKPNT